MSNLTQANVDCIIRQRGGCNDNPFSMLNPIIGIALALFDGCQLFADYN